MLTKPVKNAEEFKCLMEERMKKYHHEQGFEAMIQCDENGSPNNPVDKQVFCELEKIVMGSETGYLFCGEPYVSNKNYYQDGTDLSIKVGSRVRIVYLKLPLNEQQEWKRFLLRQIIPKIPEKAELGLSFYGSSSGTACAYPGGCK